MKTRSLWPFRGVMELGAAVGLFLGFVTWLPMQAGTLTVNSLNDPGDGAFDPSEGTLREAIAAATAGDTIEFSVTGTITLTAGDLVIKTNLAITGPGAAQLTINANHSGRVFKVSGVEARISGMRICGGSAPEGGGVYVDVVPVIPPPPAPQFPVTYLEGKLILNNCEVSGNSANQGGGIYVHGLWNPNIPQIALGRATVSNCTIHHNNVAQDGGGLFNRGDTFIGQCIISTNVANQRGGGVFNAAWLGLVVGALTITQSAICSNSSEGDGGGVFNEGDLDADNSTFSGNLAFGSGAGIFGHSHLNHVTLTGNLADLDNNGAGDGGGICGTAMLENSLVAGNFDTPGNGGAGAIQPDFSGTNDSLGHNLIQNTNGCVIIGDPTGNKLGADPLLGPLADHGGPTPTHALSATSPAIDSATTVVSTDQRGYPRPRGHASDIGAFEYGGVRLALFSCAIPGPTLQANTPCGVEIAPFIDVADANGNSLRIQLFVDGVIQDLRIAPTGVAEFAFDPFFVGLGSHEVYVAVSQLDGYDTAAPQYCGRIIEVVKNFANPGVNHLTIVRDFLGGTPPTNTVGGGNLYDIFNAAADLWELAIHEKHVVTLHFGWEPLSTSGAHYLFAQGGSPNRETEGKISFDNDNSSPIPWFLDPTPYRAEEFLAFTENQQNLGGGDLTVGRYLHGATGQASDNIDLFAVALHEIGHALGMSLNNTSWTPESADGDIDVTAPRPFPGTVLPLATNIYGITTHFDVFALNYGPLMAGLNGGERRLPSEADILGIAEISQFTQLNLHLSPVVHAQVMPDFELGQDRLMVSWSAHANGSILEQCTNLTGSGVWEQVNLPVCTGGGRCSVRIPIGSARVFFRLSNPNPLEATRNDTGPAASTGSRAFDPLCNECVEVQKSRWRN